MPVLAPIASSDRLASQNDLHALTKGMGSQVSTARQLSPQFSDGRSPGRPSNRRSRRLRVAEVPSVDPMPKEVLDYLNGAPEEYLLCREERHSYPRRGLADMRFRRNADGEDVVLTDCDVCGVAFREEKWLIREDANGRVTDMRLTSRTTKYHRLSDDHPAYLLPGGTGRVSSRGLLQMRVASHFIGGTVRRMGKRSEGGTG